MGGFFFLGFFFFFFFLLRAGHFFFFVFCFFYFSLGGFVIIFLSLFFFWNSFFFFFFFFIHIVPTANIFSGGPSVSAIIENSFAAVSSSRSAWIAVDRRMSTNHSGVLPDRSRAGCVWLHKSPGPVQGKVGHCPQERRSGPMAMHCVHSSSYIWGWAVEVRMVFTRECGMGVAAHFHKVIVSD